MAFIGVKGFPPKDNGETIVFGLLTEEEAHVIELGHEAFAHMLMALRLFAQQAHQIRSGKPPEGAPESMQPLTLREVQVGRMEDGIVVDCRVIH